MMRIKKLPLLVLFFAVSFTVPHAAEAKSKFNCRRVLVSLAVGTVVGLGVQWAIDVSASKAAHSLEESTLQEMLSGSALDLLILAKNPAYSRGWDAKKVEGFLTFSHQYVEGLKESGDRNKLNSYYLSLLGVALTHEQLASRDILIRRFFWVYSNRQKQPNQLENIFGEIETRFHSSLKEKMSSGQLSRDEVLTALQFELLFGLRETLLVQDQVDAALEGERNILMTETRRRVEDFRMQYLAEVASLQSPTERQAALIEFVGRNFVDQ